MSQRRCWSNASLCLLLGSLTTCGIALAKKIPFCFTMSPAGMSWQGLFSLGLSDE